MTQRSWSGLTILSRHSFGTYQGIELTRNSLGNARTQSSQLAEPLCTDPWPQEWNYARELISTKKKKNVSGKEEERKN